jgi:hypothetical protein
MAQVNLRTEVDKAMRAIVTGLIRDWSAVPESGIPSPAARRNYLRPPSAADPALDLSGDRRHHHLRHTADRHQFRHAGTGDRLGYRKRLRHNHRTATPDPTRLPRLRAPCGARGCLARQRRRRRRPRVPECQARRSGLTPADMYRPVRRRRGRSICMESTPRSSLTGRNQSYDNGDGIDRF